MASALIAIDQAAPNPSPTGIAGRARDDLLIGVAVTLRNSHDTDVNRWIWQLKDRPLGSTVVLSSITSPQVTFVPDIPGSYRVQLAVNDGTAGELDTRIAGIRDGLGRLYPAADQRAREANYLVSGSPNQLNWAKSVEQILRSLGVPQLLNSVQAEAPAVAASVNIVVGAMGLPASSAQVTGYDFVDIKIGNAGAAPTVNGESFAVQVGDAGLAQICIATIDLDTSGTTIGDEWALIMLTDATALLLAKLTIT